MEPAFATVRRVLRACGFDLSMALVPFEPTAPAGGAPHRAVAPDAQGAPRRRPRCAAASSRWATTLDPYAILEALDEQRVDYILIGSLARVLQGADEVPGGVDLVFPKARRACHRRGSPGDRDAGARGDGLRWRRLGLLERRRRRIKALETPEGTKGHRDLRRRAERVHLGGGLRPRVAAPGDLVRMMEALGRPEQAEQLEAMRRVVELDRGLGPDR